MTIAEYYRRALWTPLVLPLLAIPSAWHDCGGDWHRLLHPNSFAALLVYSLAFHGIPHLLFLGANRSIFREDQEAELRSTIRIFPMKTLPWNAAFAVVSWFALRVIGYGSSPGWIYELFSVIAIIAYTCGLNLVLGYVYVLLIQSQLWVMKKAGVVQDGL